MILVVMFLAGVAAGQQTEADVYVARALLALEEKRYDEALTDLKKALELDPDNVDALYYTGFVLLAQDRVDAAIEVLERARKLSPQDEAILFQLGLAHFSLEKYEQAQPLLERAFASNPRVESLGYYVGFMRYRDKAYRKALEAFKQGASADPEIQQLTLFYTGLASAALGLSGAAATEIQEALRRQPASPLTGPAERVREALITAAKRERPFRAEVRMGAFYDDNVPVNPEPSSRDSVVEDLRHRKKRSVGELGALRLDYSFFRSDLLELAAAYSFFTTYNNSLTSFNLMSHTGGLTATHQGELRTLPYQLQVQYSYEYTTLRSNEFSQRQTVSPVVTLVEGPMNLTAGQLRWQKKEYSDDAAIAREEKQDGTNWMAGFTHIVRFSEDKHLLKLGYQRDFDDTEGPNRRGRNWSYLGHRALAGGQYTLPWAELRLKYDFDVHIRDYRYRHTVLPPDAPRTKSRFDKGYTHVLGFVLPLPANLAMATDYQASVDRSNIDAFSYHRKVLTVFITWSY